jgi:hypothetical protein
MGMTMPPCIGHGGQGGGGNSYGAVEQGDRPNGGASQGQDFSSWTIFPTKFSKLINHGREVPTGIRRRFAGKGKSVATNREFLAASATDGVGQG